MNLAIFIVHYTPLEDRKKRLELALNKSRNKVYWISEKDIEFNSSLFNHELKAFGISFRKICMDRSNNSRSIIKSRRKARVEGWLLYLASLTLPRKIAYLTDNSSPIREREAILELTLMHIECLKLSQNLDLDWCLILEDDAVFEIETLEHLLQHTPWLENAYPAWYNLSAGAGLNRTKTDAFPDRFGFFRVKPFGTRCASGYLINRLFIQESLSLISRYGIPDWTAIDVIYQMLQRRMRAKAYWQDPPSVFQGSETGQHPSNFKH